MQICERKVVKNTLFTELCGTYLAYKSLLLAEPRLTKLTCSVYKTHLLVRLDIQNPKELK
jgi:hypothetical protein